MLLKFIFFVQPTAPPIHQFLGKLWKISILGVLDGSLLFNEMTHQSFWNFHGPSFTHIFLLSDQDIQRSSLLNSPFVSITDSTSSQYLSILSATWIYPAIYIYTIYIYIIYIYIYIFVCTYTIHIYIYTKPDGKNNCNFIETFIPRHLGPAEAVVSNRLRCAPAGAPDSPPWLASRIQI